MTILIPLLVMTAGSLGWGAMAVRLAVPLKGMGLVPATTLCFGLGMGLLGWWGFVLGALGCFTAPYAWALCLAGIPGLVFLPRPVMAPRQLGWANTLLLIYLLMIALGDALEAIPPPTDADSLAYHFAIPRQMSLTGHLVFVPRGADGAVPLIQQTGYGIALLMGGEGVMTGWAALTGWVAVAVTFVLARRWLCVTWSLALAALMASLPAFLYGAGSGQVEARMAAFIGILVWALMESRHTPGKGWAMLAGMAAGLAIGSKYPALFLALLGGLLLLPQRKGLAKASLYGVVALVVGGQWYGWNWWNSGDPVFPMLFGIVPYAPGISWDAEQNAAFKHWIASAELPLVRDWQEFLIYPFRLSFFPHEAMESGRTGLGPWPALMLPPAFVFLWLSRRRLRHSDMAIPLFLCFGFYVLWFWFGASQRVRHYLPLMPLALVLLTVACLRLTTNGVAKRFMAAALVVCLMIQAGAQVVFVRPTLSFLAGGEDRQAYLRRLVERYAAQEWLNAHKAEIGHVLITVRQWLYFSDTNATYFTPNQTGYFNLNRSADDVWGQLRRFGITHLALPADANGRLAVDLGDKAAVFEAAGCLSRLVLVESTAPPISRALSSGSGQSWTAILRLEPVGCPYESKAQAP